MASFNKKSSKTYLLSEVRGINAIQESIAFAFLKIAAEQLIVFIFQKESLLSCFKAGGHNSNSFSAIAETSSLSLMVACFAAAAAYSLGDKWALYGPNLHSCLEKNVATKNGLL